MNSTKFKWLPMGLLAGLLASAGAAAPDAITFQGKTITMIIGYAAGGGTDASGRLIAASLDRHLPGSPSMLVRNMPGADGMTAANYFVQQVAPDGLTIMMASSTTADPLQYRKQQSHFDPTTFGVIGGVGRGGSFLMINREAEKRLTDKQARPVMMGTIGGVPRSGMQITGWGIGFLGWNAKWVVGYRGTNDVMLALERGEIDMTATANLFQIQKLLETGRFKILSQTGTLKNGTVVTRPEFADAPNLARMLEGKTSDPLVRKAFDYWSSIATIDKWLALPPKSPKPMLEAYRVAYSKLMQDSDFLDRGRKMSEDIEPMSSLEVESLLKTLGDTPPAAIDYIGTMLSKQGLSAQ
jgi:hypothetical protein